MIQILKKHLFSEGTWFALDQSIVSGATFVLNVLLVSLLGVQTFGTYSLYWMIILFISGFHQSLIVIPMYTLYAKMENLSSYFGVLFREQLFFSLVSGLVTIAAFYGLMYSLNELVIAEHGVLLALIAAVHSLHDFLRRILFIVSNPKAAALIDFIGIGVLPIVIFTLSVYGSLSLTIVLIVTLVCKLSSIGISSLFLVKEVKWKGRNSEVRKQHWQSGKYLVASNLLQWCGGNTFILISGAMLGTAAVGVLRIAQSIMGVINVFFLYLENRVPIHASRILQNGGSQSLMAYIKETSAHYFWLLFGVLFCITVFHQQLTESLFGESLEGYQWLIPAYCLLYLFIYAGTMLRFVFRTIDQNSVLFYGYLLAAVIGLSMGYPLVRYLGMFGVIIGLFLTQIATIFTYTYFLKRQS